jgi:hypothetical protein
MKLFLFTRTDKVRYDETSDIVVAAKDEAAAEQLILDAGNAEYGDDRRYTGPGCEGVGPWHQTRKVTLLGTAVRGSKPGIITRSYHAG